MALSRAMVTAAILSANPWGLPRVRRKVRQEKKIKTCLNCGKEHQHSNTCCSAECFKSFRDKGGE